MFEQASIEWQKIAEYIMVKISTSPVIYLAFTA